jgi:hypothetical protein
VPIDDLFILTPMMQTACKGGDAWRSVLFRRPQEFLVRMWAAHANVSYWPFNDGFEEAPRQSSGLRATDPRLSLGRSKRSRGRASGALPSGAAQSWRAGRRLRIDGIIDPDDGADILRSIEAASGALAEVSASL